LFHPAKYCAYFKNQILLLKGQICGKMYLLNGLIQYGHVLKIGFTCHVNVAIFTPSIMFMGAEQHHQACAEDDPHRCGQIESKIALAPMENLASGSAHAQLFTQHRAIVKKLRQNSEELGKFTMVSQPIYLGCLFGCRLRFY
jgi:hypothetical protein